MAKLLAHLFWPSLLIGLALAVAWRFVLPGKLRTNLQIIASLLVLVPQAIIIFLLYQSIALLLYQEALLSLWMLGAAALITAQLRRRWSRRPAIPSISGGISHGRKTEEEIAMETAVYQRIRTNKQRNPAALVLAIVATSGFGLYLARMFVKDAFYPRIILNGRVERLSYNRGSRAPRLSDIVINGQTFQATRDLHGRLQPGDHIRAEVGAGSRAVLRWDYMAPPGLN